MSNGHCGITLWYVSGSLLMVLALIGCVHPVEPIGSTLRADSDSAVRRADCQTVRLNEIQYDWNRDRSCSLPCLELENAVYYIQRGGRNHRPLGTVPNVLVKERPDRQIVWKHAVSAGHQHPKDTSLDTARLVGHYDNASLIFIQSSYGLSIIREADGAFLYFIGRFYHPDLQARDVDVCTMNGDLVIGLFLKKGGGVEEQEWFVLPKSLLMTPER
ncbi:MAG: hypothetical protein KF768_13840 [Phycisphaeraceae bacterium]|nr:hypothetical protein [Phycisphaeraceae bacterium]